MINSTFAEALAGRDPIDITGCELHCLPSTHCCVSIPTMPVP
jgi:hypothetical protein